jgi:hypothetical protein
MPDQQIINEDFDRRITALERQANGTPTAEERHDTAEVRQKHWYRSVGVWMATILTLIVLYLVYLLWQKSTGHIINIFGLIRF